MRKLLIYPNDILTTKAEEVAREEISILRENKLFDDMLHIVTNSGSRGLAAPQLGVSRRVIIILDDSNAPLILINPTVIIRKGKITSHQEGCLSLPGQRFDIKRSRQVTVTALDEWGKLICIFCGRRKITSIVLQHEIDHLNGVLILNRKKGGD